MKETQLNIAFGRKKRNEGMAQAEYSANQLHENWSEKAYEFLKGYAERNAKFQLEDVRFASQGIVPVPRSQRAWGGVTHRAVKEGIIYNLNNETEPVRNVKAHCALAKIWRSNIYQYHQQKKAV